MVLRYFPVLKAFVTVAVWLAPFEPNTPGKATDNAVYITLPAPTALGAIRLWNYSKVPPAEPP